MFLVARIKIKSIRKPHSTLALRSSLVIAKPNANYWIDQTPLNSHDLVKSIPGSGYVDGCITWKQILCP